jgi:NitT/TauT family transport system ATP-binding protein
MSSISSTAAAAMAARPKGEIIEVSDVSVRYHLGGRRGTSRLAVDDVSFTARPGEFLAIAGPSGCGKSTLLKAVASLLPISGGSVRFSGGEQTKVGFLFQADALLPWRTAKQNVEIALRMSGDQISSVPDRAEELLADLGLAGNADRYPSQLSGGMRKRVAMARTLAYNPSVFLMDEPFSALDAQTRIHVGNFFLRILEETHQTVLFVTHDIDEAVALADRVVVLSKGPGRVVKTVDVHLPRPRDYHETRFVPGFKELQHEVWSALEQVRGGAQ